MTGATTTCEYYNPVEIGTTSVRTTQFGSSTCYTLADVGSSSQPYVAGGFTYGEMVVSVLLFVGVVAGLYAFLWFTTHGVKIRQ